MNQSAIYNAYYHGHHKGFFFWLRNARSIALPQSLLPAILAVVLCLPPSSIAMQGVHHPLSTISALLAVLGVAIGHLAMNLADDYYDYRRDPRIRSTLSSISVRARLDKCTYINNGDATPEDLFRAMVVFTLVAGLCGVGCVVAQFILHGVEAALAVVFYAALGLIFGLGYSRRPLDLAMRGLGEPTVGLIFGPFLMLGVQAACTGSLFSWRVMVLSLAIGLLVTNILFVHSVMETKADEELGKMTLARKINNKSLEVVGVAFFGLVPYILIAVGVLTRLWSAWYLLSFITIPMTVYLIVSLSRFTRGLPTNDNPRWWMGPMPEFHLFQEAKMDWFLIRWLLARNVVMYFCLIIIIIELCLHLI